MAKKKAKVVKKLKKFEDKFDLVQLKEKYKLPEDELIEKINEFIDEEQEISKEQNLNLTDDALYRLVSRSFNIHMRGHSISKAEPAEIFVLGKSEPFNYGMKRREQLEELFRIDPRKAMKDGIRDAICDKDGNIIFKTGGKMFKKGVYPENRYSYNLYFIVEKPEDPEFKKAALTITNYTDDLVVFNALEQNKWYSTKINFREYKEGDTNVIGSFSTVSEFKEIKKKVPLLVDISNPDKPKGELYKGVLLEHYLDLADGKKYYDKFKDKNGRIPSERFVVVVADIISFSESGKTFYTMDDSLEDEDINVPCFDNRGDKSLLFGPKSKVGLLGTVQWRKDQDNLVMTCHAAFLIPREKGGFFYPSSFEPVENVEIDIDTLFEDEEDVKDAIDKVKKSETKEDEILSKIMSILYELGGKAEIDTLKEQINTVTPAKLKKSLDHLVKEEIILLKNGWYEIE
jgi:hypothetical protein